MAEPVDITEIIAIEIKAHALTLLTAKDGFNGLTADEIARWKPAERDRLRNAVATALVRARDEHLHPWEVHRAFGIGKFDKAHREIAKIMKERRRATA